MASPTAANEVDQRFSQFVCRRYGWTTRALESVSLGVSIDCESAGCCADGSSRGMSCVPGSAMALIILKV